MAMITDIEDYFQSGCGRCERFSTPECSALTWNSGLSKLRQICRDAGLQETVKWGQPCYMHAKRNIVVFGAFRGDFRMSFFNGSLMKDPEGELIKRGPNSQHKDMFRFISEAQVTEKEHIIRSYLKEAMGYAEAGIKPEKDNTMPELPDELLQAMDGDPELAEAFHKLTPGRQKSYILNLNSAKQASTRFNRIAKFKAKILAGKGAMER